MSGMASAASTIPGSVATFCSCSSERSPEIASSSSVSAKTRAGTRMSGRASAGISYSVSSSQRPSDIEHQPCVPAPGALLHGEPVVGDRLDEMGRKAAPALDLRPQPAVAELERRQPLGYEVLGLGE